MATKFSVFQEAIFEHVLSSNKNLAINAVAGSGKTTTIVECAKRLPKTKEILFLAFNKTIATELSERMANFPNVTCSTLHAHGLSGMKHLRPQIDKYADYNFKESCLIASEVLSIDSEKQYTIPFKNNCSKLYSLARINLIREGDLNALYELCDMHLIETIADEVNVVNEALKTAYTFKGKIDFTDMLVLPLEMKKTIKKYDIVFIDECQDLSKAQRELMLASVKKGGKFIAVGDRQQAINGFCGASCDSFDLIAKIDNTDELPLSVNYRCGKSILALAQQIVPQITPFEGAIEGEVIETDNLKSVKANDMILCRKSAPLVGLCLKFIANGKKAYVKGKDIGEGLLNLVTKMKAKNLNSLFEKLDAELNKLKAVAETNPRNGEAKYIAFKDKCECLEVIADSVTSIKGLKDKLNEIFSDAERNSIALSTIHKSKGLEADNVFIIVPDKLPLRWKNQLDWQLEQEMNLKYVAFTRAKKVLTIVNLDENELKKVEF